MSTTPQTPEPQKALQGAIGTEEKILYMLHYRRGDNPHPMTKFFRAPKNMKMLSLVERCKNYCTTMSFRFISVAPFESDLDLEEKKHNEQV
jgi:hypothetical protein